jgi:hypothetical protein
VVYLHDAGYSGILFFLREVLMKEFWHSV